jgi:ABC-type Fe3+-hydroxamate transport system substrate-binding protein
MLLPASAGIGRREVAAFGNCFPGVSNCGVFSKVYKSPTRAVTLNQGATEIMLALGLQDKMVGTAYLDDEIWPEFQAAYNKIPALSGGAYPTVKVRRPVTDPRPAALR